MQGRQRNDPQPPSDAIFPEERQPVINARSLRTLEVSPPLSQFEMPSGMFVRACSLHLDTYLTNWISSLPVHIVLSLILQ